MKGTNAEHLSDVIGGNNLALLLNEKGRLLKSWALERQMLLFTINFKLGSDSRHPKHQFSSCLSSNRSFPELFRISNGMLQNPAPATGLSFHSATSIKKKGKIHLKKSFFRTIKRWKRHKSE
jgi:hypothetical protein